MPIVPPDPVPDETWQMLPRELRPPEWVPSSARRPDLEMRLRTWAATRGDSLEAASTAAADAFVRAWAARFENLVDVLRHRPQKALDLLAARVVPFHFPGSTLRLDPAANDTDGARTVQTDLPTHFASGLIQGFVALTGRAARVQGAAGALRLTLLDAPAANTSRLRLVLHEAVRVPFLAATLIPVLLGAAVAAHDGHFDSGLLAWTLVGVAFFHAGTNLANAYFETRGARDERRLEPEPDPAPQRDQRALAFGALAAYASGTAVGLWLVYALWPAGFNIFWLGVAGFFLGLLYTAPPARLAHRGVGELAVAVGFGPLIVLGAYFVQAQAWSRVALLASLPLGALIAAVLYINEFPDKEGDARVGKRTLIVRLPDRTAVAGYHLLLTFAYVTILAGVILQYFPVQTLGALATVPLAVRASILLSRNYRFPYRLASAHRTTTALHVVTGFLFLAGFVLSLHMGGRA